jgi:phosphomannomutase
MAQLGAIVKAGHADIGFAHDADGERLGIVTELGEPLSEELTFALATRIRLQENVGPVVTNVSTTSAIDQIAADRGGEVIRTAVGQAYISEAMIEHEAVLGGEGSGGVSVPELHPTHDGAAAAGLILQGLASSDMPVSEFVRELPSLTMLKHNISVEPNQLYSVLQNFRMKIEDEHLPVDLTDGIKVVLPQGWIHVRASNTESMIRVIAESEDPASAQYLLNWVRDRLTKR